VVQGKKQKHKVSDATLTQQKVGRSHRYSSHSYGRGVGHKGVLPGLESKKRPINYRTAAEKHKPGTTRTFRARDTHDVWIDNNFVYGPYAKKRAHSAKLTGIRVCIEGGYLVAGDLHPNEGGIVFYCRVVLDCPRHK
jgi:hypothetical protein